MNDSTGRNRYYDGRDCEYQQTFEGAWTEKESYIAAPELAEAVNIALHLRRPLLLEGDPGAGKTRPVYSVAYELGYPRWRNVISAQPVGRRTSTIRCGRQAV